MTKQYRCELALPADQAENLRQLVEALSTNPVVQNVVATVIVDVNITTDTGGNNNLRDFLTTAPFGALLRVWVTEIQDIKQPAQPDYLSEVLYQRDSQ